MSHQFLDYLIFVTFSIFDIKSNSCGKNTNLINQGLAFFCWDKISQFFMVIMNHNFYSKQVHAKFR